MLHQHSQTKQPQIGRKARFLEITQWKIVASKDLYPQLENFIDGYFHQNWIDLVEQRGEPKDYDYIVNDVLKEGSRHYLLALSANIVSLLATGASEERLREIIRKEFGGNIDPVTRGSTWRGWLEHVNERITEHLKFSLK